MNYELCRLPPFCYQHSLLTCKTYHLLLITYNSSFIIKKIYQPISRILLSWYYQNGHHLSGLAITGKILLPTLLRSRFKRDQTSRFQAQVYMALQHTRFTQLLYYYNNPWALTSHFHPHPPSADSYFLWHFLLPVNFQQVKPNKQPALNRCVALCCPDFPLRKTER